MAKRRNIKLPELSPIELHRIVSMEEAARVSGVSDDTLRRHHRDKIVRMSPRRIGMRLGDALGLRSED
jgi:hypothetical protein